MQDLIKQEQFEIEVLDRLNSARLLDKLLFGGGTMLRLCFGLDRFSVDLDFWLHKPGTGEKLFADLQSCLRPFYTIRDAADKFNTLLIELKKPEYPRSLKLEIRKTVDKVRTEKAIAFSKYSTTQVFLRVIALPEMMTSKISAFLDRKEIRDAYDIEFLVKRGVELQASSAQLAQINKLIDELPRQDYRVKLSSLLEAEQRQYYRTENFKILKGVIQQKRIPDSGSSPV